MSKEITIYCDESTSKGRYCSDFYGGIVVAARDIDSIKNLIAQKKLELGFFGEVKWTKITENYAGKYIQLIDLIFDLLERNKLKI